MMKCNLRFLRGAVCGIAALLGSAGGLVSQASAVTLADSLTDWSATGEQGFRNWLYGWRDFTADGGLQTLIDTGSFTYDPFSQFIPFTNTGTGVIDNTSNTPGNNQWDGGQYRLYRESAGPWTSMGAETAHPNGTNSVAYPDTVGHEQWVIRRWVANDIAAPTQLEFRSHLRATNVNGPGTSVHLFQNGVLLDTLQTASGTGLTNSVYPIVNPGDIFDFALTPASVPFSAVAADRSDGSDGSAFRLTITDNEPPVPPVPPYADSFDDWSTTGTQGEKNWFNGWYNKTADGDGSYGAGDFIPYVNDGSNGATPVSLDGPNQWNGSAWDVSVSGAPWSTIQQELVHPNGANSAPNNEQWVIRRYVANDLTETTPMALQWHARKQNLSGAGVTGKLFVNGVEVGSRAIAGNDGTGFNSTYYVNANPGDVFELALSPVGPTGDTADGADGSYTRLTLRTNLPDGPLFNSTGEILANSIAEFSGNQGQDNWFYGYYDVRADFTEGDGIYSAGEMIPFLNDGSNSIQTESGPAPSWQESPNHWNGSKFDLLANASRGPWTELANNGGHPAANGQGQPEVHWAVRRWMSESDDAVRIAGTLHNTSSSGDGTVGRIFVDGVEVWSEVSNGNAIPFSVDLALSAGQLVDFVIDPDGAGVLDFGDANSINLVNDGSDGTTFSFSIERVTPFVPVPEPATGLTILSALVGFGFTRRRK
jgi:hypothetical protein